MQNSMIQLHDIKPLMEIPEYSFYYFIVGVTLSTILLFSLLYLLLRWLKNRKKFNIKVAHSKLLHQINYKDAKKDAYAITLYGLTFKDETPRHQRAYEALVESLEAYKYKKDVPPFNDETKHLFEIYLGLIDV